jgi:hypothetical protein
LRIFSGTFFTEVRMFSPLVVSRPSLGDLLNHRRVEHHSGPEPGNGGGDDALLLIQSEEPLPPARREGLDTRADERRRRRGSGLPPGVS